MGHHMGEAFDPYCQWLDIPESEQPPDHYRLLGVARFESDPNVISDAADRQLTHVRTFAIGSHGKESQRLLNDITRAKICLLDPQAKSDYDRSLRPSRGHPSKSPHDFAVRIPWTVLLAMRFGTRTRMATGLLLAVAGVSSTGWISSQLMSREATSERMVVRSQYEPPLAKEPGAAVQGESVEPESRIADRTMVADRRRYEGRLSAVYRTARSVRLLIQTHSTPGTAYVEAFADDPNIASDLLDYESARESAWNDSPAPRRVAPQRQGDIVTITGIPLEQPPSILSSAQLVRFVEIQRLGDPESLVVVGRRRAKQSRDDVIRSRTSLWRLLRDPKSSTADVSCSVVWRKRGAMEVSFAHPSNDAPVVHAVLDMSVLERDLNSEALNRLALDSRFRARLRFSGEWTEQWDPILKCDSVTLPITPPTDTTTRPPPRPTEPSLRLAEHVDIRSEGSGHGPTKVELGHFNRIPVDDLQWSIDSTVTSLGRSPSYKVVRNSHDLRAGWKIFPSAENGLLGKTDRPIAFISATRGELLLMVDSKNESAATAQFCNCVLTANAGSLTQSVQLRSPLETGAPSIGSLSSDPLVLELYKLPATEKLFYELVDYDERVWDVSPNGEMRPITSSVNLRFRGTSGAANGSYFELSAERKDESIEFRTEGSYPQDGRKVVVSHEKIKRSHDSLVRAHQRSEKKRQALLAGIATATRKAAQLRSAAAFQATQGPAAEGRVLAYRAEAKKLEDKIVRDRRSLAKVESALKSIPARIESLRDVKRFAEVAERSTIGLRIVAKAKNGHVVIARAGRP